MGPHRDNVRITVKEPPMNTPAPTDPSALPQGGPPAAAESAVETLGQDDPTASGNLDKIRDILFGAQARDHERRFAQLEQHLLREATDLRTDLKRRFDTLETYIKKEVDALAGRLAQEQELRGGSVKNLAQELAQLAATLEHKARQLDQQRIQAQSQLQQQLTERASELATDIRTRHAEVTVALARAVEELRAEKTDRSSLAAILLEASKRLSEAHTKSHG
jgi:DNA anti-recombination protein RmuC